MPSWRPRCASFLRTDAFSLQPADQADGAHRIARSIFHQSRAWTDAGSRGFELTLDRRPALLRAHPLLAWQRDRRSRQATAAARTGGHASSSPTTARAAPPAFASISTARRLETDVVRDHLYKDIGYRREAGDRSSDTHPLTIGARFRDSGFKNGLIDDLQVFDVALTAAEVAGTSCAVIRAMPRPWRTSWRGSISLPSSALAGASTSARGGEPPRRRRPRDHGDGGDGRAASGASCSRAAPTTRPGRSSRATRRASLPPFPQNQPRNRLGLARWLTDRGNPLAARVVVNRIWRMHFGRGIVAIAGGLRQPGKAADPSRAARLACRLVHG